MSYLDYLRIYDAFVPVTVCVLPFLFRFAVPSKHEFKKLECNEVERRVISLPTMWLRASLMLEYADCWLSILSFGCSLIVVIMIMFDDPYVTEKAAIYSTIVILASTAQWIVQFRRGSGAYRVAFNGINAPVLEYRRLYIEPLVAVEEDAGSSVALHANKGRTAAFIELEKLVAKQERLLYDLYHGA